MTRPPRPLPTSPTHERTAFTLIELLVVIAIIALLIGILLPTLATARATGQSTVCRSQLRQIAIASTLYADDADGRSPALGVPWGRPPFWAIVVQATANPSVEATASQAYTPDSVLVCPSADRQLGGEMTRTYAVNVTGHAGFDRDTDSFDEGQVHIRLWAIARPSETPWYLDSSPADVATGAPPSGRTPSTIDFRDPAHTPARLGFFHAGAQPAFHVAHFDASVTHATSVDDHWLEPLP